MADCVSFVAENIGKISDKGKCFCCLGFTAVITLLVCISVSIEGIEPTEYGLVKDNISQKITGDVYEGGLSWVGITNSIIRYPRIIQAIEFSDNNATRKASRLKTRTSEGLEISISCALQYRLIKDDLPKVYRMFEEDFEAKYIRIARSIILNGVSQWSSFDFWQKRTEVGDAILKQLRKDFKYAGAYIVHFNLMKIDLPSAFNNAIIATQVMIQDYIKFSEVMEVEKIKRETENIKAQANKRITIIKAEAQKEATVILEQAKGEIAAQSINGITSQLKLIRDNLFSPDNANPDATTKANIMQYFQLLRIENLPGDTSNKLFYNVGDGSGITTLN